MDRPKRKIWRALLSCALPLVAQAIAVAQQSPASPLTPPAAPDGSPVVDIIPLRAYVGGTPLRCGNLVPGSESVELNGRKLTSGTDYAIDYVSGVVYLMVPPKIGETLVVGYRASSKAQAASATALHPAGITGFSGFEYGFLPGANALVGLGITDRAEDGTVTSSNLYGWHNKLNFGGGGSLAGLYILADQQQGNVKGGFSLDSSAPPSTPQAGGRGQFLLQNFHTALMGGSMAIDYQQITRNFSNFGAVRMSGYSDDQVQRLKAERGLTRTGLSFQGLKLGGMALSNTVREVGDGSSHISWRSFGLQQGGFKFDYSRQQVGENFQRFSDLGEADKQQLAKERGMSRESFGGEFAQKAGKLSFSSQSVSDDMLHSRIHKTDLAFASSRFGLDLGSEDVGRGFSRASSLNAGEAAQWGREVGLKRQWFAFNASLDSKSKPFTFDQVKLSGPTGAFSERDAAYTGKTWSLQHIDMRSGPGFASMGALQDSDANNLLQKVASHYGDKVVASGADKASFLGGTGISRDYTGLNWHFAKDCSAKFDLDRFKGSKDGGSYQDMSLTGKSFSASFRSQRFGQNFAEAASLMPMEQARMGSLPGLRRQDLSFSDQFSKLSRLDFSSLEASTPAGSAHRTLFGYTNSGIEISGADRGVSPKLVTAAQLVDPEAGILGSLVGFEQRDLKWNLTRFKNIKFTGEAQDARNEATGEVRGLHTTAFTWNLDRNTQLGYTNSAQKDANPLQTLFDSETQQVWVSHNFGRFGKFEFMRENDIARSLASSLPDCQKNYVSFETQLNKTTSLKAEDTMASYSNGQKQNISAETLSTQLSKRAGVSITEVQSSGSDQGQDPAKHNYGLWYDLGNGVRISYGYAHQLQNGADAASSNLTVGKNPSSPNSDQYGTLQAGTIGSVNFAGGYGTNQYLNVPGGANHTQAFSNIALSTVKPLKFGPISDVKFNFGMDTASDYTTWTRENHSGGFSGQFAGAGFGFDYKSQLAAQGVQGVDRTFHFQTNQSPKSTLKATILYKVRTLPGRQDFFIRDFNITAKPARNLEITNLLQTNPEVTNSGVFLGSIPQAARSDKWALDYHQGADTTFGVSYQELINESSNLRATTGGLNLKLFQKSGSPLTLFFGQEDDLGGGMPHRLMSRYTLQFDQHPGAHQTLSMFLGNVSYDYYRQPGIDKNNWTARFDYTLRF